jgi:hypothetical protein
MNRRKCDMKKHASRAALAALALGASLAFAAPAHADTASYLAWLQNHGVSDPLANGTSLLSMGTQECAALRCAEASLKASSSPTLSR